MFRGFVNHVSCMCVCVCFWGRVGPKGDQTTSRRDDLFEHVSVYSGPGGGEKVPENQQTYEKQKYANGKHDKHPNICFVNTGWFSQNRKVQRHYVSFDIMEKGNEMKGKNSTPKNT